MAKMVLIDSIQTFLFDRTSGVINMYRYSNPIFNQTQVSMQQLDQFMTRNPQFVMIFDYEEKQSQQPQQQSLISHRYALITSQILNLNDIESSQSAVSNQYPLSTFLTDPKAQNNNADSFRLSIEDIVARLHKYDQRFKNVPIIALEGNDFFGNGKILDKKLFSRKLDRPKILENWIDLVQLFHRNYKNNKKNTEKQKRNQKSKMTIESIAKQFGQFRNLDRISLLKNIVLKMNQDRIRFYPRKQNKIDAKQQVSQSESDKSQEQSSIKLSYFECIGLPFSMENQYKKVSEFFDENSSQFIIRELIFIKQTDGRFSGNIVIKVLAEKQQKIIKKNKSYMKNRYIEVRPISEDQYRTIKEEHRISQQRYRVNNTLSANFNQLALPVANQYYNGYSLSSGNLIDNYSQSLVEDNQKHQDFAIRIRGLPFSFSEHELQKLFSNYRPKRNSSKIGHYIDSGFKRKSGQAMMLFDNQKNYRKAFQMDGYYIGNRYLEIKSSKLEQYKRFR